MKLVIPKFRRLSVFEDTVLQLMVEQVNPVDIFVTLWAWYAANSRNSSGNLTEEYQGMMRTLEDGCSFILELIEEDWGRAVCDMRGQAHFKMEGHFGDSSERSPFEQIIETWFYSELFRRDPSLNRDTKLSLIEIANNRLASAYNAIAADWDKILNPPFDYQAYLMSSEWKARRDERVQAAGHRCQVCNDSRKLNVHHRTYERIGNEIPEDLIVLCSKCHTIFHVNGRLAKPGASPIATDPAGL